MSVPIGFAFYDCQSNRHSNQRVGYSLLSLFSEVFRDRAILRLRNPAFVQMSNVLFKNGGTRSRNCTVTERILSYIQAVI